MQPSDFYFYAKQSDSSAFNSYIRVVPKKFWDENQCFSKTVTDDYPELFDLIPEEDFFYDEYEYFDTQLRVKAVIGNLKYLGFEQISNDSYKAYEEKMEELEEQEALAKEQFQDSISSDQEEDHSSFNIPVQSQPTYSQVTSGVMQTPKQKSNCSSCNTCTKPSCSTKQEDSEESSDSEEDSYPSKISDPLEGVEESDSEEESESSDECSEESEDSDQSEDSESESEEESESEDSEEESESEDSEEESSNQPQQSIPEKLPEVTTIINLLPSECYFSFVANPLGSTLVAFASKDTWDASKAYDTSISLQFPLSTIANVQLSGQKIDMLFESNDPKKDLDIEATKKALESVGYEYLQETDPLGTDLQWADPEFVKTMDKKDISTIRLDLEDKLYTFLRNRGYDTPVARKRATMLNNFFNFYEEKWKLDKLDEKEVKKLVAEKFQKRFGVDMYEIVDCCINNMLENMEDVTECAYAIAPYDDYSLYINKKEAIQDFFKEKCTDPQIWSLNKADFAGGRPDLIEVQFFCDIVDSGKSLVAYAIIDKFGEVHHCFVQYELSTS